MRRNQILQTAILLLIVGVLAVSCAQRVKVDPPVAKIEPKVDTLFGHVMVDDYFWLRDKENPEVISYLEAENAYTEAMMKHTEEFEKKLYDEMLARIKETDLSVPVKNGDYYYYSRTEEGKDYSIYCRKHGSLEADEEILLDLNQLAEGQEFVSLGIYDVSPNHKLLAYGLDTAGNERYTLRVKNLETGELYDDVLENLGTSFEWANDNKTFFYTINDDAWRPFKIFRHTLGGDPAKDALVFHEPDEAFFTGIYKSKDEKYLFIYVGSKNTSEIHFLKADNPTGKFTLAAKRKQDVRYQLAHRDGMFYIVTDEDAPNYKLMQTTVSKPQKKYWKEVIPHRTDVLLNDVELFKNFMVIYERRNGVKTIRIRDFATDKIHQVEFPEPVYDYWTSSNPDYNGNIVRFTYTSLVTPRSVYDYDMKTHERELKKQQEVLGGYNADEYQSERIFATAEDGTQVPVSLVYKKSKMKKDGSNPLYLYGYGAYGASWDVYFSSNRLSILDRGFTFAIAHIRGGEEMGRHWYEDGKMLNKKNSFTDFIACAEHLIAEKYTSSDGLVISGGSAGGLLVGAVVNMRPELFKGVIAEVPFVDIMNTMLDPSLPLTVIEYEEWGNPNVEEYFNYMLSYSPYDNVKPQAYPNMLITTSLNDTRVQYWEPAKWTAKLRANKTDDNLLLFKIKMVAGHGGVSGRYERWQDLAFEYAFMFDLMGITK